MKIKLTSVYVDNQDKALRFYTEVLGLTKEGRLRQRAVSLADRLATLTRGAGMEPRPTVAQERQPGCLRPISSKSVPQQGQPAPAFFDTDDVKGDYERIKARAPSSRCRRPR